MKIGKARVGSVSTKKYFKLEKGDNVYRVLPPLGDLADKGVWAVYHKVHYGYRGLPGPDGKARMRPFASPEVVNRQTRMVEVTDAAKERIEKIKQALSEARDRGDTESMKQLSNLVRTYNLDAKWYVNALNLQGEIGLLKIPHKAKQALEAEIQRLRQEGVNALDAENGRYFVFQRTGEGRDTQYQVKVYKQKIEVPGLGMVDKDMPHSLTEDVVTRLDTESHKLDDLFRRPTAEQVVRIVKEGASAVEEILGRNSQSSGSEEPEDEEDLDTEMAVVQTSQPSLKAAPLPQSPVSVPKPKASAPVAQAPTSSVSDQASEQSPEDFLKSIGLV